MAMRLAFRLLSDYYHFTLAAMASASVVSSIVEVASTSLVTYAHRQPPLRLGATGPCEDRPISDLFKSPLQVVELLVLQQLCMVCCMSMPLRTDITITFSHYSTTRRVLVEYSYEGGGVEPSANPVNLAVSYLGQPEHQM